MHLAGLSKHTMQIGQNARLLGRLFLPYKSLLPPDKRSCWKVMFLQVSVCLRRGAFIWVVIQGCMQWSASRGCIQGVHLGDTSKEVNPGGMHLGSASKGKASIRVASGGCTSPKKYASSTRRHAPPPPQQVSGTQSSGMHTSMYHEKR